MLRGKTGDLARVNALYDETCIRFFKEFHLQIPHIEVLDAATKNRIEVEHEEIVMLLENSVPPWYSSDRIRCLWKEKEIFILRNALELV